MEQKFLAQIVNPVIPPSIGSGPTETGGTALGALITNIIGGMLIVAFLLAFLYLATGAIQWITSGGDKTNLESARNRIIHAIVGLIIVAAAWAIVLVIGQFIGIDFKNLPIPSFGSK